MNEYKKALDDFTQAINLKPDYLMALQSRGFVYYKMGKYKEALDDDMKVISLNPTDPDFYNNRAKTYKRLAEQTKNKKQKAEYEKKSEADFAMMEKLGGTR
jgi:tetratricopeptide (TPR) repeat protein